MRHHCFRDQILTAQQMCDVCNEVRKTLSLDWDNCVTHSPDNTNSMIGQRNSLLRKMQSQQGDYHLAHF